MSTSPCNFLDTDRHSATANTQSLNSFSTPIRPNRNVTFSTPDSVGAETFRTPSPSDSMLAAPTPSRNPRTPNRAPRTPRNGRHSVHQVRATPRRPTAHGPTKNKAKDVWTFFKEVNGRRECIFCQYVLIFLALYPTLILFIFRQKHVADASHSLQTFSLRTGTTTLRSHLCGEHLEPWVNACDKFKITIMVSKADHPVNEYRCHQSTMNVPGTGQTGSDRHEYSPEAFVDAILEFIVADDQVRKIRFRISIVTYMLLLWSSR